MTIRLFRINANTFEQEEDIDSVLSFSWKDNLNQVFASFNFTSTQRYNCGDRIQLFDDFSQETVLFGVITRVTQDKLDTLRYEGFDYGYYLVKNTAVIQFERQTITNAMINLCTRYGFRAGNIQDIPQQVTKIYRGESLDSILMDLYRIAVNNGLRNRFYFDCRNGSVNLFPYQRNDNLRGYIANSYSINSFGNIMGLNNSQTIDNLKNRIELWSSEPTDESPILIAPDQTSIERFGLLNQVETVNPNLVNNIEEYIVNRLNSLNQVTESFSLTVYSDFHLHKGVFFQIDNERIDMNGLFLVTSSEHIINGTEELVNVTLERFRN